MKNKFARVTATMAAATLMIVVPNVRAGGNDATRNAKAGDMINEPAGAQSSNPAAFLKTACMANTTEIKEGQLAEEKAQSDQVKMLGQRLVQDHQAMAEKIKALAQQKDIQIPTSLDAKHQKKVDQLSALSGAAFDKKFVMEQVRGHEKTIALFKAAAANNTDPDVKNLAENALPTLQEHLQMARQDASVISEPAGAENTTTPNQNPNSKPVQNIDK